MGLNRKSGTYIGCDGAAAAIQVLPLDRARHRPRSTRGSGYRVRGAVLGYVDDNAEPADRTIAFRGARSPVTAPRRGRVSFAWARTGSTEVAAPAAWTGQPSSRTA